MELEKAIGDLLRKRGLTVSIAESCTGGLVSDRITNVSGSSDYFEGAIVSYSLKAKAQHLGIPLNCLKRYGAASPQAAKRMAEGVRKAFDTTFGLSTTGVAGPTGGTKKTPVGTVFIGYSDGKKTFAIEGHFRGDRRAIKEKAAEKALQFLWEELREKRSNAEYGIQNAEWMETLRRSKDSAILIVRRALKGISSRTGRLGILPASFNPPTLSHRALIREAKKVGRLDEVLVLLDVAAMDKEPGGARFEDRLEMVKMAFQRDPKISIGVSNRGLFLDKLEPLRDSYPAPIEVSFIVGFDTILRVMDRRYYKNPRRALDRVFAGCQILVANRGTQEREAFERLFRRRENMKYRQQVSFFTLTFPPMLLIVPFIFIQHSIQ